ncbi:MAG: phosphomannomutase/phosphoglucomutase [Bdellovibrionales bacterium]
MKTNPEIYREYDIRGVYKVDFDESFAKQLAKAHVSFIKAQTGKTSLRLTVGHDARLSSPSLAQAIVEGYMESGAHVYHLGLVTTPISYFSTFHMDVDGAIMVTGSHNPPEYNGFKISVGKGTIFGEKIKKLQTIIDSEDFVSGKGSWEKHDILDDYVARYKEEFAGLKSIPFVLDCGNGAAGCVARKLYEAVGLKPKILFEEPDGLFPNHHPDPTVEKNLVALVKEVKATKSLVGIGFDGDADRIGLVDDTGRMIYGDELMVLVSRDILKSKPGQPIIGDVKCSDRLYADIKKLGGRPIMWKTGHSLIKDKIKEEKSPFGGEMSGHIFFADRNYGYDDALYAGIRVVEILSRTGKTIAELLEGLPTAYNTPELRIDTTEQKKRSIVDFLIKKYTPKSERYRADFTDGVRVSFKDGWALARASNTQPVLVLRFESSTEAGLKEIQGEFESAIKDLL